MIYVNNKYLFVVHALEMSDLSHHNRALGVVAPNNYEQMAIQRAETTMMAVTAIKNKYDEEERTKAIQKIRHKKEIARSFKLQKLAFLGASTKSDDGPLDDETIEERILTEKAFIEDIRTKREKNDFATKMIFGKDHSWRYLRLILMAEMWIMSQEGSRLWNAANRKKSEESDGDRPESVYDYLMVMVLPENWLQTPGFLKVWMDRVVEIIEICNDMVCVREFAEDYSHTRGLQDMIEKQLKITPSVPSDFKKQIEDLLFMGILCYSDDILKFHIKQKNTDLAFANPRNFEYYLHGESFKNTQRVRPALPRSMENSTERINEKLMTNTKPQAHGDSNCSWHRSMFQVLEKLILGTASSEEERSTSQTLMKNFMSAVVFARTFMMHGNYWTPNSEVKMLRGNSDEDVSFAHSVMLGE